MMSMSRRQWLWKDYRSVLGRVQENFEVATNPPRCRSWRITARRRKMQSAAGLAEQPAVYTNIWHKSTNRQTNRHRQMTNHMVQSSNKPQRRSHSGKHVEITAVNDAGAASLTNTTQRFSIRSQERTLTTFRIVSCT